MKKRIIHIINGNSPHPKRFFEILNKSSQHEILYLGTSQVIYTKYKTFGFYKYFNGIYFIFSLIKLLFFRINSSKQIKEKIVFHGHSAGKIGLFCFISGFDYTLTIYGSEVYTYEKKSLVQKWFMEHILAKANHFLVYSDSMKEFLIQHFEIVENKITVFNFGINEDIFDYSKTQNLEKKIYEKCNPTDIVFFVNRRIHPYYNTIEIINSFNELLKTKKNFFVIFLEGKFDIKYKQEVIKKLSRVKFNHIYIGGFIIEKEISEIYSISDYSLSFPNTDEISASVLQSLAMGVKPLINITNDAYKILDTNYFQFLRLDQLSSYLSHLNKLSIEEKEELYAYYKSELAKDNTFELNSFFNNLLTLRKNND